MLKKPGKQYGLIKKKKPETKVVATKLSFFNDDDDEDDALDEKKRIEKELKKTAAQKKVNKQTQVNIFLNKVSGLPPWPNHRYENFKASTQNSMKP